MVTKNLGLTESEWGDAAFGEINAAFPGKLKTRAVALCVWCHARWPDITEEEIEAIAGLDSVISKSRSKKKIGAQGMRLARTLLGLDADAELPEQEREILCDLRFTTEVVAEYKKAKARLQKAEAAYEAARDKMRAISPHSARKLAGYDPKTKPILEAEGLLGDEPCVAGVPEAKAPLEVTKVVDVECQPERVSHRERIPVTETTSALRGTQKAPDPESLPIQGSGGIAAADQAVNLLKKRVSRTSGSLLEDGVDGVRSDAKESGFHPAMDECTDDYVVYWPDQRESLND